MRGEERRGRGGEARAIHVTFLSILPKGCSGGGAVPRENLLIWW